MDTLETPHLNRHPTLVVCGKNDEMFIEAGRNVYKKDLPKAEIHQINGGHFLLEEHHQYVAELIENFMIKLV